MFTSQLARATARASLSSSRISAATRPSIRGYAAVAGPSKPRFSLHQKDFPVEVYPLTAVVAAALGGAVYCMRRAWIREPDLLHHRSTGNAGVTYGLADLSA